jgi:protein gp37
MTSTDHKRRIRERMAETGERYNGARRALEAQPPELTLHTHDGRTVPYPRPKAKATFNETKGPGISWAGWSWNPVTGCLHGCPYCWAREFAHRFPRAFPAGFMPVFHHERLAAPANTRIPQKYRDDAHVSCGRGDCKVCEYRRVFVVGQGDLYGRWVPGQWIAEVHAAMIGSPQWEYLLLTKFPGRYPGLAIPPRSWVGTSVDEQRRVRIAEEAFREIRGDRIVRWLSLEPLREPLQFSDLSMFDWIVIGAQRATQQPFGRDAAFDPPWAWVQRIADQAREAGCALHLKPNLRKSAPPGVQLISEYPAA